MAALNESERATLGCMLLMTVSGFILSITAFILALIAL